MLTSPFNKWVSIDGGLTFRRNRTMEKVLDAFRVEARKIGGDALITPVSLRRLEGIDQSSSVDSNGFLSAIVIQFMDPECQRE